MTSARATHPFQVGYGATVAAASPDEHAANATGWSLEFRQLGRGRFAASLAFALSADSQYVVNEFSPGLMSRGAAPPGTIVMGVPMSRLPDARFRGEAFTDSRVWLLPPGVEMAHHIHGAARLFATTLPAEAARAYFEAVVGVSVEELRAVALLQSPLAAETRCRQLERIGLRQVLARPGVLADPVVARQFQEKVLQALCAGLRLPSRRGTASASIARRAEEFLLGSLDRPVTIKDVCLAAGATERTLHEAFRRHLGTTPKAHLKLLRLHAVRRELWRAGPGATVTAVAMRWGFFHFGWFSQDYRRLFGCSPSETLNDARAASAVSG